MISSSDLAKAGEGGTSHLPVGGLKRLHESESSDSDKEHATVVLSGHVTDSLQLVSVCPRPSTGGWTEVKKKKGKKGKIDDYFNP